MCRCPHAVRAGRSGARLLQQSVATAPASAAATWPWINSWMIKRNTWLPRRVEAPSRAVNTRLPLPPAETDTVAEQAIADLFGGATIMMVITSPRLSGFVLLAT